MTWQNLQQTLAVGTLLRGEVIKHMPFGVFLKLEYSFLGLIQIVDFKDDDKMDASQYPAIGTWVEAVVLGFTDEDRKQIWLSVKSSQILEAKHNQKEENKNLA